MICPNCGKDCPDSSVFCGGCGAPLPNANAVPAETPATTPEQPVYAEAQTPDNNSVAAAFPEPEAITNNPADTVYGGGTQQNTFINAGQSTPVPVEYPSGQENLNGFYGENTPKKKLRIKPVPVIITITAIAIVTSLVIVFFPFLKNQFRNLFYSDEKYMSAVINDDVNEFADGFAKSYDNILDLEKNTGNGSISLTLSKNARRLLKEVAGNEGFANLNKATLEFENAVKGNSAYIKAKAKVNGKSIDASAVVDDGSLYIKTDATGKSYYEVEEYEDDALESIGSIKKTLPDKGTVKKLIVKYGKIVTKHLEDVEKSKEKVKFGDIEKNTVQLTATIDSDYAYDALTDILETAQDDKEIKKIIEKIADSDFADADADEAVEEYEDGIDSLLDNLDKDNFRELDELECTLTLNVDAFGNVVCRTLKAGEYEVSLYTMKDGKKVACGIVVKIDRREIRVTAKGEQKGNKLNGKINLEYNGISMTLARFEDIDIHNAKNGKMSGKIIISGSDFPIDSAIDDPDIADFIGDSKIVISFDIDDKSAKESIEWTSDGEKVLNLNINFNRKSISIPSVGNAKSMDDMTEKQREKLENSFDDLVGDFIYSPYIYDDYDDYDDDEDYYDSDDYDYDDDDYDDDDYDDDDYDDDDDDDYYY